MPDFVDDVLSVSDALVLCLCFGERLPAEEARRAGCDQPGGCPELCDATDFRVVDDA